MRIMRIFDGFHNLDFTDIPFCQNLVKCSTQMQVKFDFVLKWLDFMKILEIKLVVLILRSKILWRLMYNRFILYINHRDLSYQYQFGFQRGKSTHMPPITLIADTISKALDQVPLVNGMINNFSNVFDTVNLGILHQKLELYGVQDIALLQNGLTVNCLIVYNI